MLGRHPVFSLVGACRPSRSLFSLRRPLASSTIQLFVRAAHVIPKRDYSSGTSSSDNSRPARTTLTTPGTPPPPSTKNVQGNFKVGTRDNLRLDYYPDIFFFFSWIIYVLSSVFTTCLLDVLGPNIYFKARRSLDQLGIRGMVKHTGKSTSKERCALRKAGS